MSGLVDYEAVLAEFEAFLVEDGRSSHGTDYLTRKLAELRAKHRIDESSDRATIRRFTARLTEVFFDLTPVATDDPLTIGDPVSRETADAGGDGRRREPHDDPLGGHDGSRNHARSREPAGPRA